MAGDYIQKTLGVGKPVVVSRNPFSLWEKPIDWESKKMNHLLFVGRVEYRKGLQTLLQALDEMGEAAKGLTLRVVGHMHTPTRDVDRRCLEYFQAHLDNRAGTGNYTLEYAGPAAHADMPGHYDWAGIQVMPSLMDNYPYVALEGLSRGCFVIGSEVGGIPEIIDRPERGLLFASENSTLLAEKIRECRRREQEISEGRRKMAEEIRSEFALESCYRRLMEVYGADLSQRTQG
jgi:glycosyltransferase involved in cell wall biosynthesis